MGFMDAPVRQSAVAGQFYPAQPKKLDAQITGLFNQVKKIPSKGKPKILIVPHAGIIYSGKVAAWGFKQIENLDYSRIILLGASHQALLNHAAIFDQGVWETPLGKIAIDESLAKKFLDKNIVSDPSPHLREHSLELELIFLQKVIPKFKILPILVSRPPEELISSLAKKISQALNPNTLLVISTDLSHYPPYETANEVDRQTIEAIISGHEKKFIQVINKLETANYSGLDTAACGQEAIRIALKVAEILEIHNFTKINYANSGDITGEKSQVVGYASIVAYA